MSERAALRQTETEESNGLEPDVLLPSQFYQIEDTGLKEGERKLMSAILSDGIEAYIAHCSRSSEVETDIASDAAHWVNTVDQKYVFSFDNVCMALGIDPDYLREGLKRYVDAVNDRKKRGDKVGNVWKRIRRPRKPTMS